MFFYRSMQLTRTTKLRFRETYPCFWEIATRRKDPRPSGAAEHTDGYKRHQGHRQCDRWLQAARRIVAEEDAERDGELL